MFGSKNKSKWLMAVAFLAAVVSASPSNSLKNVKAESIVPRDAELVLRAEISAGGTVHIMDLVGNIKKTGINSFNGNHLTQGRNFIWDATTINYGVAATGTSPAAVDYSTALPPALRNSEMTVLQNQSVIRTLSVASINEAKSTDARFRELDGFAFLEEELSTAVDINFPDGAALNPGAGNGGFIEIIFKGFETHIKR